MLQQGVKHPAGQGGGTPTSKVGLGGLRLCERLGTEAVRADSLQGTKGRD